MLPVIQEGQKHLPVQRLCSLTHIARSSYYRKQHAQSAVESPERTRLRQELVAVCGEDSSCGYRRATHELRRRGFRVGYKRIRALMHKENLRCRRKKRWIQTTDSKHGYRIYPNLAQKVHPKRPGQLWVSDITYVRVPDGFVFLAVVLDAYTRRVVGWAMSRRIDSELTKAAVTMALKTRRIKRGLMHHSDRGVQYASTDYIDLLKEHRIVISMSRKGNPYDNAKAESFMKTVKTEEVHISDYGSFPEAKDQISHYIDIVYNNKRLHSALDYKPPAEFEAEYFTNPSTFSGSETVPL